MEKEKRIGLLHRFLNILFNIAWFLLVGLGGAISCFLMGLITTILIIPIFFKIPKIWFGAISLVISPAGKRVTLNFSKNPITNTIYLIFGGLINYIGYMFEAIILCITLIGIPLGIQLFKFAKYFLAPIGAEIEKL